MTTKPDPNEFPDTIQDHYIIESHGRNWYLYCKVCSAPYVFRKGDIYQPFVEVLLQHLVDHAVIEYTP